MVYFQQKLLEKAGVTKTQTSKTQTSDPEKLRPLGVHVSKTHAQALRKTHTPWVSPKHRSSIQYFSNIDVIGYLLLLITIYQSAKRWVACTCAMSRSTYTTEMNEQVSCFQISIGSGTISQSDSG